MLGSAPTATRLVHTLAALACASVFAGCAPPVAATPYPSAEPEVGEPKVREANPEPGVVTFMDRELDLGPFVAGFPYGHFEAEVESGQLFYLETGERYTLRSLPLPAPGAAGEQPPLKLEGGAAVTEVDWSKRSLWSVTPHPETNALWLHADANNDERMNLWRMDLSPEDPAKRVPEQITTADYVYGYGLSEDRGQIAYLARSGQKAPYSTCLRILDANDPKAEGADKKIVCDSPELSFTWSSPRFSPDGQQVYFVALTDGDRKQGQIVEVDLRKQRRFAKVITDAKVPRSSPNILHGWVDGEHLLYTANDAGFGDLYKWSRKTRKTVRLTKHGDALLGAEALDGAVVLAHGTPAGSTVDVVSTEDGKVLGRAEVAGRVSLLDGHGDRLVWAEVAPNKVYEANIAQVRITKDSSGPKPKKVAQTDNAALVRLSPELESQLVHCEAEAVSIPTFDDRQLHAFVLRPRQPLSEDPAQGVALVRSFYGGDNEWTRYDHVLCAAGMTVVSASVRGSSGFGKDFYALNDRDLGGDEIVDLFWIARWIEAQLGIPAARIGVYGRSHGGYATMRAMTFPPETNGRNEAYRFAFGLAEAGFSDIVAFHDATNIPDWVVLEAGDPAVPEDRAKLEDRSPINHVERLDAPIFLLHGGNDWRVPVEGSRAFAKAAEAAGKQVVYVEIEGQGHRIEGRERIVEAWQARLDFIESVLR